jgi:hypothetical protein
MAGTEQESGEAATIRAELDVVFPELRDLAAELGGHLLNLTVGYAYGYAEAMLKEGNLPAAREKLDWLKNELIAQSHAAQEAKRSSS